MLGAQTPNAIGSALKPIELGQGYQFQLLGAGETPAQTAHPKTLHITVASLNASLFIEKARLIEGVDRVFEAVLLNAAEKGYYTRAVVNLRSAILQPPHEFVFLRGANGVWLRQAGKQLWQIAQDTKWSPPAARKLEIKGLGTLWVEQAVPLPAQDGFKRAIEIDLVSKSNIVNYQQKYVEIKALWAQMDREKMRAEGYDLVLIGNFSTPQIGRFFVRRGFFVRIPKLADGKWAELPERAPDERETLVSESQVPVDHLLQGIQNAFALGLDTMRLSPFIAPTFNNIPTQGIAQVDFAEGLPIIQFDPNVFVRPIP